MGKITDKKNYILHCGNIDMLCTPIEKKNCIKYIKKIYGYTFIYGYKVERTSCTCNVEKVAWVTIESKV